MSNLWKIVPCFQMQLFYYWLQKKVGDLYFTFLIFIFEGLKQWLTTKSSKTPLAVLVQLLLWECELAWQKPGLCELWGCPGPSVGRISTCLALIMSELDCAELDGAAFCWTIYFAGWQAQNLLFFSEELIEKTCCCCGNKTCLNALIDLYR